MIMLLWTAADLANSSLCALENEDSRVSRDAFPLGVPIVVQQTGDPSQFPSDTPVPHIDDCFCCSHCVDVPSFAPAMTSARVQRELQPLVSAAPRIFGSRLYHPPLA
jgi:hypothetical protein